jgi:hypothetical protein
VWLKKDLRSSAEKLPANVALLPLWYRNAGDAEVLRQRPWISSKAVL